MPETETRTRAPKKTTTISFPTPLLLKLKHHAVDNNTSVSELIVRWAKEKLESL